MQAVRQQVLYVGQTEYKRRLEVSTFWRASVEVRRGLKPPELIEKQINSAIKNIPMSDWLRDQLGTLLELNKNRIT